MALAFQKRMVNRRINGHNTRMGIMTWWNSTGVPFRKAACNGGDKKCGIKRSRKQMREGTEGYCQHCDV